MGDGDTAKIVNLPAASFFRTHSMSQIKDEMNQILQFYHSVLTNAVQKRKTKHALLKKTRLGCLLPAASRVSLFNVYKEWISSGSWSVNTSPALVRVTPRLLLSKRGVPTHSSRDCIRRLNAG